MKDRLTIDGADDDSSEATIPRPEVTRRALPRTAQASGRGAGGSRGVRMTMTMSAHKNLDAIDRDAEQ
ncbi:hypothetical protein [Actinomycetospora soli]|uniref:hypothetical protein n=1 Tax=Actinomycetospora soli TaxID=2893887 RepID=UPI001E5AD568|nr:hypothetical protein [Actinomycetospora soli]MCD2186843.1 hypothetical protein [Actinomycetospora soli]